MKIDEFVSTVLTEIVKGVKDAREIEPELIDPNIYGPLKRAETGSGTSVQTVDFDIAVTTVESSGGGGSAGISVMGFFQAGGKAAADSSNTLVSRIKFSVPIAFSK